MLTFGPSWDNMRQLFTTVYLNLQGWHQGSSDQTEREKHEQEKIPPNLAMALGSPFDKFITAAMKRAFQTIHRSRTYE